VLGLILIAAVVAAEPPAPLSVPRGPADQALEQTLAAGRARQDAATEEQRWHVERERLEALVAAAEAEASRSREEAAQARVRASEAQAAVPASSTSERVRQHLEAAALRQREALVALARTHPPGAVAVPAEGSVEFEAVAASVAASERAATQVTVEVVSGQLAGAPRAAKVLRIAGARAWWLALDGRSGGTVAIRDGVIEFQPVADPAPIADALAAVEGRGPVRVVLLPEAP
jgi:hypothetical protein